MKTLLPFLKLYRRHILRLLVGMLLAVVTLAGEYRTDNAFRLVPRRHVTGRCCRDLQL